MIPTTVPTGWRVTDGAVPLIDVQHSANLSRNSVNYAVGHQMIPVRKRDGRRGYARMVDVQTGLLIMAAAALALAVGAAFVTVYRALQAHNAVVTPDGITIPLSLAA